MAVKTTEIADFYQQLALLIQGNLPLPDSVRQLGVNFHRKGFRQALAAVSEATAKGQPLHEALAVWPQYFQPFHVRLIATGEASGALLVFLGLLLLTGTFTILSGWLTRFTPDFILQRI